MQLVTKPPEEYFVRAQSPYIPLEDGKDSNFKFSEFLRSDTASRLNIENIPDQNQWESIHKLVWCILQPIRDQFGPIRITSGFRSPELCIAIGSYRMVNGRKVVTSNHAKGQAADIEPVDSNIKLIDIMEWINDNCEFRELIAEYFPGGWIHVAYREGANTKHVKLKDNDHHYSKVIMNYIKTIYEGV